MSDGWNIALLGATGAVGEALLELLQERQFPVGELYPLASERSAGANVRFNGKSLLVQNAEEFDWSQAQLAFFVAGSEASARYAEEAGNMGCLVIDTSGLFAMEPDVPLVVPGVNPQVLADYRNRNIVAVADSMVSQLLTAIKPLGRLGRPERAPAERHPGRGRRFRQAAGVQPVAADCRRAGQRARRTPDRRSGAQGAAG